MMAVASLCYYATLCSRFIPLVRDESGWKQLYGEDSGESTLPSGCIEVYLVRARAVRE